MFLESDQSVTSIRGSADRISGPFQDIPESDEHRWIILDNEQGGAVDLVFGHHRVAPTLVPLEHFAGTIIVTTEFWRNITLVYAGGIYSHLGSQLLPRKYKQ